MVFSTNVADQEDTLAAQYNNLRSDVLDPVAGHNHNGLSTGGRKIDHGDLLDTNAISGTYLTHAKLNKHVQGAGTSTDPDDPGGSQGVHGLSANAYVAGSIGGNNGVTIQHGSDSTTDWEVGGLGYGTNLQPVEFDVSYDAAPMILVIPYAAAGQVGVRNPTADGFTASISYTGTMGKSRRRVDFRWIAFGEISA